MPRAQLRAVRHAGRGVWEAVFGLHHVLHEGFEAELLQARLYTLSGCGHLPLAPAAYERGAAAFSPRLVKHTYHWHAAANKAGPY